MWIDNPFKRMLISCPQRIPVLFVIAQRGLASGLPAMGILGHDYLNLIIDYFDFLDVAAQKSH